jgi:hypothetical protein
MNTPRLPMTLGNRRERDVHHLIGYCHNDACRHQTNRRVGLRRSRKGSLVPPAGDVQQMR